MNWPPDPGTSGSGSNQLRTSPELTDWLKPARAYASRPAFCAAFEASFLTTISLYRKEPLPNSSGSGPCQAFWFAQTNASVLHRCQAFRLLRSSGPSARGPPSPGGTEMDPVIDEEPSPYVSSSTV